MVACGMLQTPEIATWLKKKKGCWPLTLYLFMSWNGCSDLPRSQVPFGHLPADKTVTSWPYNLSINEKNPLRTCQFYFHLNHFVWDDDTHKNILKTLCYLSCGKYKYRTMNWQHEPNIDSRFLLHLTKVLSLCVIPWVSASYAMTTSLKSHHWWRYCQDSQRLSHMWSRLP